MTSTQQEIDELMRTEKIVMRRRGRNRACAWHVKEHVTGNVTGDVTEHVTGDVAGHIIGHVRDTSKGM